MSHKVFIGSLGSSKKLWNYETLSCLNLNLPRHKFNTWKSLLPTKTLHNLSTITFSLTFSSYPTLFSDAQRLYNFTTFSFSMQRIVYINGTVKPPSTHCCIIATNKLSHQYHTISNNLRTISLDPYSEPDFQLNINRIRRIRTELCTSLINYFSKK